MSNKIKKTKTISLILKFSHVIWSNFYYIRVMLRCSFIMLYMLDWILMWRWSISFLFKLYYSHMKYKINVFSVYTFKIILNVDGITWLQYQKYIISTLNEIKRKQIHVSVRQHEILCNTDWLWFVLFHEKCSNHQMKLQCSVQGNNVKNNGS